MRPRTTSRAVASHGFVSVTVGQYWSLGQFEGQVENDVGKPLSDSGM